MTPLHKLEFFFLFWQIKCFQEPLTKKRKKILDLSDDLKRQTVSRASSKVQLQRSSHHCFPRRKCQRLSFSLFFMFSSQQRNNPLEMTVLALQNRIYNLSWDMCESVSIYFFDCNIRFYVQLYLQGSCLLNKASAVSMHPQSSVDRTVYFPAASHFAQTCRPFENHT